MENEEFLVVRGARTHNLKNIDVSIPRDQLVVVTGLSGSGKSSLAFDTIYAEGQRRYVETLSSYARQFLGGLERPDVDKIDGLSPVIAIEQKTTSRSPRSTVGTITEVYDFLRLLFARVSDAYSWKSGRKMVQYTEDQILELILKRYNDQKLQILAPVIVARKGHYRELFEQIARQGFVKVRVDGEIRDIERGMKLDRYKTHDIEIVVDRLRVSADEEGVQRLRASIQTALYSGQNLMMVIAEESEEPVFLSRDLMCPETGLSYPVPEPNTFSFNSPKGMCPRCSGLGVIYQANADRVIPDRKLSIHGGGLAPLGGYKKSWAFKQLDHIATRFDFSLKDPIESLPSEALEMILYGGDAKFQIHSRTAGVSREYSIEYEGVIPFIENQFRDGGSASIRRWAKEYMDEITCPECQGARLKKEALYFRIGDESIFDLARMDLDELRDYFGKVEDQLDSSRAIVAREILKEIRSRIGFLCDVGLGYLSLNRGSRTLSGGEAQRIRLATQIGSQLVGVLYILDEPSIGLHQRDNERLIHSLMALRDIGNSVIVVEHDRDMITQADYVIDLGPRAGKHGGEVISEGPPGSVAHSHTLTADYLSFQKFIPVPEERRKGNGKFLSLTRCTGNNLKGVSIKLPLGLMIGVTGVSGSGKSTLINETLYPILNAHFFNGVKEPLPYGRITGLKHLDKVIDINQSPIGRTPRSNPATYTGVYSEIRSLFSRTTEATIRGYKPGRFSFNVVGGRCETCSGGGLKVIEMNFLPDVYVECETCQGKRFNRETLEIRYRSKNISDVLNMTIEEATEFFKDIPKIYRKLKTLMDVGLGYITLGQSSTTLSGGEAQRVKLATELSKRDTGRTFYILDEPTTGLHFEDIRVLMDVLHALVDKGNTVLIIEHNMDVIKAVDYIIDIGPEGGRAGGEIVAQGSPEQIIKNNKSHTGKFLKKEMELNTNA